MEQQNEDHGKMLIISSHGVERKIAEMVCIPRIGEQIELGTELGIKVFVVDNVRYCPDDFNVKVFVTRSFSI